MSIRGAPAIIIMDIAFKEKDFEFMRVLGKNELSLGEIRDKLGTKKSQTQKIFNKLKERGMLISRKEKTSRLVKLNNNGKYFLAFYLSQLELRKKGKIQVIGDKK